MKTKLITILLCLFPLLAYAQNYEQQGDELFAQAQYEKAEKKYKAAIEMSGTSPSLQKKKENSSKCASLLSRAKTAEESASTPADYENASKLYSDLFAIHALQTYKSKANTLKQKANAIIAQQKKAEEDERERIEKERLARIEAEKQAEKKRKEDIERAQRKKAESTKDYNDNIYDFQEHIVKKNEGLYRIGVYYGVSQKEIIKWNPELTNKGLYEGQVLYIPLRSTNQREADNSATNCIQQEEREHAKTYVNGHRAVDMGLSVRWADCNVGASAPDDAGNYYAWGETTTKASYNRQTYKFYSNSTWVLKYCTMSDYGNVDNKLVLDYQDDAASANWGERWSTPTKEQWEELANSSKCTWEWITIMRVPGYRVTSKITGNSIFIPITGIRSSKGYQHGDMGLYWTKTLYPNLWQKSYCAAYRFDIRQTAFDIGRDNRSNGRPIRAVCR